MQRRHFIAGLGSAAVSSPLWSRVAPGQQPAAPVIGFLHAGTPASYAPYAAAFAQGLSETGFVEGRNLAIEYRWANAKFEQLPALAADLVRRQVAIIVAGGGDTTAVEAKRATSTIPIVFVFGSNPVSLGLVPSLSRPGGNITGVTFFTSELMSKRLSLLLEVAPQARVVGYLAEDPRMFTETRVLDEMRSETATAARVRERHLVVAEISADRRFDTAFATFAEQHVGALIVQPGLASHIEQIVSLAARQRIPAIFPDRRYVEAGGLMAYSTDIAATWRDGGTYVGKILKGAKPADMPVAQSTKFEFLINMQTARALSIEVPPGLLAVADAVIE